MTDPAPELPRASPRHRTLKAARIVFNSDFSSFDAVIRDMSEGGVRLKLGTPFIVPHLFELVILNSNTGVPERRTCETRWQRGDQVGARFVSARAEAAPPSAPAAPTLRRKPIGA